jgi:hypothetical protein
MDSINNQRLIDVFTTIAKDARNAGTRILTDLQSKQSKLLKKQSPQLASVLATIQAQPFADALLLASHAQESAMYFFLKRLEEGEAGYEFALTMRDTSTGESVVLSSPETPDLNLRNKMFDA